MLAFARPGGYAHCEVSTTIAPHAVDAGDHVVQFYEHDEELIDGVGDYLIEGLAAGAVEIVIATLAHREAFEERLRDAGVDTTASPHEGGALLWLDAAAILSSFTGEAGIERDLFFARVGSLVELAAAGGRPVRLYGEMVALLWEAGDVGAAIELETLWNELGDRVPFSLYCAYRSDAAGADERADALARVCHLHSAVVEKTEAELPGTSRPTVRRRATRAD